MATFDQDQNYMHPIDIPFEMMLDCYGTAAWHFITNVKVKDGRAVYILHTSKLYMLQIDTDN